MLYSGSYVLNSGSKVSIYVKSYPHHINDFANHRFHKSTGYLKLNRCYEIIKSYFFIVYT
jgi:hypothetical protein